MKKTCTITPATESDVRELVANIRPEDEAEIAMATTASVHDAIWESFANSVTAYAMRTSDGTLLCIGGAVRNSLLSDSAIVWEIGTTEIRNNAILFLKNSATLLAIVMADMPDVSSFENEVPAEYSTYLKWLKKYFHATFDKPILNHLGNWFVPFTIKREK